MINQGGFFWGDGIYLSEDNHHNYLIIRRILEPAEIVAK